MKYVRIRYIREKSCYNAELWFFNRHGGQEEINIAEGMTGTQMRRLKKALCSTGMNVVGDE